MPVRAPIVPPVKSSDLSAEQIERLKAHVARRLAWLNRLIDRMDRLGWDPTDELYQAALHARSGMHELHVASHYATLPRGVGREPRC
jgi:hypothetical protein